MRRIMNLRVLALAVALLPGLALAQGSPIAQGGPGPIPGIPTSAIGVTVAGLDGNAKVLPVSLVNRPTITPTTTTVGTSATTIYPAGTYVSIRIALTATGALACTGDGTTPALGGTGQAAYGQDIRWPVIAGGAMPTGAIRCIADRSSTISTEAH